MSAAVRGASELTSPPGHRTKVAVVSPEAMIVAGLTAVLGRHPARIELVQWRSPGGRVEPDVVLYDVLGLADGGEAELDRLVNETSAVVLAVGRDLRPDLLNRALAQGVDGCVSVSTGETALVAILETVRTRERSATTREPIICACPSVRRSQRLGVSAGLNDREAAILTSIAQGLSNADIAQREFLSINTVKTYIRSAYGKIGVQTRSQAVLWALQHGYDT
jgi:DNA-binding NarL/FixJ family response regulator